MFNVNPVVLSGGFGTRLWPLSRTGLSRQFLCLAGKESLFQQAALRLASLGNADIQVGSFIIFTGDNRFLAFEQLRELGVELGRVLDQFAEWLPRQLSAALRICEGRVWHLFRTLGDTPFADENNISCGNAFSKLPQFHRTGRRRFIRRATSLNPKTRAKPFQTDRESHVFQN